MVGDRQRRLRIVGGMRRHRQRYRPRRRRIRRIRLRTVARGVHRPHLELIRDAVGQATHRMAQAGRGAGDVLPRPEAARRLLLVLPLAQRTAAGHRRRQRQLAAARLRHHRCRRLARLGQVRTRRRHHRRAGAVAVRPERVAGVRRKARQTRRRRPGRYRRANAHRRRGVPVVPGRIPVGDRQRRLRIVGGMRRHRQRCHPRRHRIRHIRLRTVARGIHRPHLELIRDAVGQATHRVAQAGRGAGDVLPRPEAARRLLLVLPLAQRTAAGHRRRQRQLAAARLRHHRCRRLARLGQVRTRRRHHRRAGAVAVRPERVAGVRRKARQTRRRRPGRYRRANAHRRRGVPVVPGRIPVGDRQRRLRIVGGMRRHRQRCHPRRHRIRHIRLRTVARGVHRPHLELIRDAVGQATHRVAQAGRGAGDVLPRPEAARRLLLVLPLAQRTAAGHRRRQRQLAAARLRHHRCRRLARLGQVRTRRRHHRRAGAVAVRPERVAGVRRKARQTRRRRPGRYRRANAHRRRGVPVVPGRIPVGDRQRRLRIVGGMRRHRQRCHPRRHRIRHIRLRTVARGVHRPHLELIRDAVGQATHRVAQAGRGAGDVLPRPEAARRLLLVLPLAQRTAAGHRRRQRQLAAARLRHHRCRRLARLGQVRTRRRHHRRAGAVAVRPERVAGVRRKARQTRRRRPGRYRRANAHRRRGVPVVPGRIPVGDRQRRLRIVGGMRRHRQRCHPRRHRIRHIRLRTVARGVHRPHLELIRDAVGQATHRVAQAGRGAGDVLPRPEAARRLLLVLPLAQRTAAGHRRRQRQLAAARLRHHRCRRLARLGQVRTRRRHHRRAGAVAVRPERVAGVRRKARQTRRRRPGRYRRANAHRRRGVPVVPGRIPVGDRQRRLRIVGGMRRHRQRCHPRRHRIRHIRLRTVARGVHRPHLELIRDAVGQATHRVAQAGRGAGDVLPRPEAARRLLLVLPLAQRTAAGHRRRQRQLAAARLRHHRCRRLARLGQVRTRRRHHRRAGAVAVRPERVAGVRRKARQTRRRRPGRYRRANAHRRRGVPVVPGRIPVGDRQRRLRIVGGMRRHRQRCHPRRHRIRHIRLRTVARGVHRPHLELIRDAVGQATHRVAQAGRGAGDVLPRPEAARRLLLVLPLAQRTAAGHRRRQRQLAAARLRHHRCRRLARLGQVRTRRRHHRRAGAVAVRPERVAGVRRKARQTRRRRPGRYRRANAHRRRGVPVVPGRIPVGDRQRRLRIVGGMRRHRQRCHPRRHRIRHIRLRTVARGVHRPHLELIRDAVGQATHRVAQAGRGAGDVLPRPEAARRLLLVLPLAQRTAAGHRRRQRQLAAARLRHHRCRRLARLGQVRTRRRHHRRAGAVAVRPERVAGVRRKARQTRRRRPGRYRRANAHRRRGVPVVPGRIPVGDRQRRLRIVGGMRRHRQRCHPRRHRIRHIRLRTVARGVHRPHLELIRDAVGQATHRVAQAGRGAGDVLPRPEAARRLLLVLPLAQRTAAGHRRRQRQLAAARLRHHRCRRLARLGQVRTRRRHHRPAGAVAVCPERVAGVRRKARQTRRRRPGRYRRAAGAGRRRDVPVMPGRTPVGDRQRRLRIVGGMRRHRQRLLRRRSRRRIRPFPVAARVPRHHPHRIHRAVGQARDVVHGAAAHGHLPGRIPVLRPRLPLHLVEGRSRLGVPGYMERRISRRHYHIGHLARPGQKRGCSRQQVSGRTGAVAVRLVDVGGARQQICQIGRRRPGGNDRRAGVVGLGVRHVIPIAKVVANCQRRPSIIGGLRPHRQRHRPRRRRIRRIRLRTVARGVHRPNLELIRGAVGQTAHRVAQTGRGAGDVLPRPEGAGGLLLVLPLAQYSAAGHRRCQRQLAGAGVRHCRRLRRLPGPGHECRISEQVRHTFTFIGCEIVVRIREQIRQVRRPGCG